MAEDIHYVISSAEMSAFPHSGPWVGRFRHFVCADILRGGFYPRGVWKQLFSEYAVGKDLRLFSHFEAVGMRSMVVYIKDYIAVVRCAYPSKYAGCFKGVGYSAWQVASLFPEFGDDADNSFYVCIRTANSNFVDLDGNPMLPMGIYGALVSCMSQIAAERQAEDI